MDESDAAGSREDEAENKQRDGDKKSENSGLSTEDITDRVFCCRDCGEAFKEEVDYLQHRHQHPQENVCSDGQMDGLRDAEKDSETPHFCTLCSLSFVELVDLHTHMKECHEQISQKETLVNIKSEVSKQHSYQCPDCGKSYYVIGHYLNHRRSHSLPPKSVFHDLEHLKKKSFQCEICGRNYSRASALDAHRRCHEEKLVKQHSRSPGDAISTGDSVEANSVENPAEHDPEVFTCSCGKTFSALMRLKTHQRFSRNRQCSPEEVKQKPKKTDSEFYCGECKKSFNGHIALFNHQRWHANHSTDPAQKFTCEQCGKVFMSLSFYYRHQRTAHSDETPAKSFLHQVCQLQKKAIECKDCGLKFSRASALHSHQLHHTDVFKETEKVSHSGSTLPHQGKMLESGSNEIHSLEVSAEEKVQSGNLLPPIVAEEEPHINETEDDMDSYEPGDFNVQVISASESEDEQVQDLNPDLELLCESDQEVRDDCDAETSSGKFLSKPEMDLKIVQIDFEHADKQGALMAREAQSNATEERFDCPDCYRWFTSPSSLRVHRMWHGVRMRRQQTQGQSVAAYTCDTCGHEASSYAEHCNHTQAHNDQNSNSDVLFQAEELEKKNLTCGDCGKVFSRLSALVSHQMHHPKRKQFQCPNCMVSYLHASSLLNHMKTCSAQKKENISVIKKEYNPKKTLLGPKLYYCEQCGKGFWSLGAYSHHKQNQAQCADLRLRKGVAGSAHGRQRSTNKVACPVCGRKFRHRGIMALHMRKHENGNHKCEVCNRSFRLFSSLLRHQVVHNDQLLPPPIKSFQYQVEQLKKNTYSCPDCGKLFSRAKALQFHMKSHGYETGYTPSSPRSTVTLEDLQCTTCFAHFSSKVSLRAHQKLCIKKESRGVEKIENVAMNLHDASVDSSELKMHAEVKPEMDSGVVKMESDTGEGNLESPSLKYKCNKCDRSFSVVGALNFHKRIHSKGYKSVSKANLVISVMCKKPKQEEPSKGLFHCLDCGRRFMSNSALGSHKRWHKDKKCSQAIQKDDSLKSVGYKTENGRFECKKCGKQFFNHRVLQRHQMFNTQCQTKAEPESSESADGSSSPEQFSCPECNKTFVQSSLLAAHYENEHGKGLEAADTPQDGLLDSGSKQADTMCSGSEPTSLTLKPKAHQCPICFMTFAKVRGLRAHKWQAHSKKEPTAANSQVSKTEDSAAVESTTTSVKNVSVSKVGGQVSSDRPAEKTITCLNCGHQFSSLSALLNHKKVCTDVKHEIQTSEATAEVPPPLGRLLDHTVKYLFRCDKCGKAFQTEEQLVTHKNKAKSRPYCCALCCHGFWTESQLQQHLTWHDDVRCRLPNELRYRLSATLTSKNLKSNLPTAGHRGMSSSVATLNEPTLNPVSQLLSNHMCQSCGKAFLSPTALEKHKSQECNSDTYHCSVCPRTFRKIQELIEHHQECIRDYKGPFDTPTVAAAVPTGVTTGLTFECIECGTTFCRETDLQKHYIQESNITCQECGLKFTHRDVYQTHLHQHALKEEEEAQMEENRSGDAEGLDESSSDKPSDSVQSFGSSMNNDPQKVHACLICGKVYTYLVSFRKHQRAHERAAPTEESQSEQTLHKYQCPDCGMSFIRRTRLLSHMRIHKLQRNSSTPNRCDQCNRTFRSEKLYMLHVKKHKTNPFWCLSCAQGFTDEAALDKHLQSHSLKQDNGDERSFHRSAQLMKCLRRPHQRTICGKSFSQPGRLISHKRKHGSISAVKLGLIHKTPLTSVREEPDMNVNTEEQKSEGESTYEEIEDHQFSEESDCGEPGHHLDLVSAESDPTETVQSQELLNGESKVTGRHREHKYKEWECVECDMGFDDMEKLHMHYIKHATGELPIP